MHDSDKHGYITFGWVATIIGVSLFMFILTSNNTGEYYGSEYEKKCAEQHQTSSSSAANVTPSVGNKEPSEINNDQYPNTNWCDLAAQYHMAESAIWSNRAAWASFAFTVLGVFLIWRTLDATQRTLVEANRTTNAALESIGEARKSNELMEAMHIAEMRPYIFVKPDKLGYVSIGKCPYIDLVIQNQGKSPARLVRISTKFSVQEFPLTLAGLHSHKEAEIRSMPDMNPGFDSGARVNADEILSSDAFVSVMNSASTMLFVSGKIDYFYGSATYFTAFGFWARIKTSGYLIEDLGVESVEWHAEGAFSQTT